MAETWQFLLSTTPAVDPATILHRVKGRLHYILRGTPKSPLQRNHSIFSTGGVRNTVVDSYVARQTERHPMADSRTQAALRELQFHDSAVDLGAARSSGHSRFVYSLHVVVEMQREWSDPTAAVLRSYRDMIIGACKKKSWLLSRIGLLHNHIHVLLGASLKDSPEDVALSLMNNLAYTRRMAPVFRNSYYVGTFGNR